MAGKLPTREFPMWGFSTRTLPPAKNARGSSRQAAICYCYPDATEIQMFRQILAKLLNIKFYGNLFKRFRVSDEHRRTDQAI
jgi:hypothetical protein